MSGKNLRCNSVTRYSMVSMLLTFRRISASTAKKYKDFKTLEEFGLLTTEERNKLEEVQLKTDGQYSLHWVPIRWAQMVTRKVRDESKGFNRGG